MLLGVIIMIYNVLWGFSIDPPYFGYNLVMSTHASILVDNVGPPSAEVCRTATSFP
jgi:hypothetical protein